MIAFTGLFTLLFTSSVSAQYTGDLQKEIHPQLPIQSCSAENQCTDLSTSVVLDANWRWIRNKDNYQNCYSDNWWNTTLCSNNKDCAAHCALEGADYKPTYSITTTPAGALNMKLVTRYDYSQNIGSRIFLLASRTKYQMFKLLNREFSFEVDVSTLPCGVNAALYFVEMEEDGGMKKYPSNKAGAQYGTGYCSAKCPRELRFINGEANAEGWRPSELDPTGGTGNYGSCCAEVGIWEANSISTALTPHSCSMDGQARCEGADCVNGLCDKDGCDFNSYRNGDTDFFGPGKTVDTNKNFTVVTQFITKDGTDTGALTEIRRSYVQNGTVIKNSVTKIPSVTPTGGISDAYCSEQKAAFKDTDHFSRLGGMKSVGAALGRGMVLAISILEDYNDHMLWLDGPWPKDGSPSAPGVLRGSCAADSGEPYEVEHTKAQVTYRNIRVGAIGTTVTVAQ